MRRLFLIPLAPMRNRGMLAALALVTAFSGSLSAQTQSRAFVGPSQCTSCHEHEDEKDWADKRDGNPGNRHIDALNLLSRPNSDAYAKAVGLANVYDTSGICVKCHATVVRGSADYGVSCESCHGAGADYLAPHQQKGSYEKAIALGLKDVWRKPDTWVSDCLSCHLLNANADGARLAAAGHPTGEDFANAMKFEAVADHWTSKYSYREIRQLSLPIQLRFLEWLASSRSVTMPPAIAPAAPRPGAAAPPGSAPPPSSPAPTPPSPKPEPAPPTAPSSPAAPAAPPATKPPPAPPSGALPKASLGGLGGRFGIAQPPGQPPAGAATAPAATIPLERYPAVDGPTIVEPDVEFALQFSLTESAPASPAKIVQGPATPSGAFRLPLPARADQTWMIDVIAAAPGFQFRGGVNQARLQVKATGDSTPAPFFLKAEPRTAGDRNVFFTLWHEGLYLGKVLHTVRVATTADAAAPSNVPSGAAALGGAAPAQVSRAATVPAPKLEFDRTLTTPDLTIVELPDTDEVIINSPYLQPTRDRFPAPLAQLSPWIRAQLADAAAQSSRGLTQPNAPAPVGTKEFMLGFGAELYRRVAPEGFKQALRKFHADGQPVRTLQIVSSNPVIPWELMRPVDVSADAQFLGIETAIGRFHVSQSVEQYARPPQQLVLDTLVVIAPTYADALSLAFQHTELESVMKLPGTSVADGSLGSLIKVLQSPPHGVIHFIGHGLARADADTFRSAIRLTDVDLDLMRWRGLALHWQANRPLVFFNACEVGEARQVANFVEGWAPAVLEAGAAGYIGGLWPLGDRGASEFGAEFYRRLSAALTKGSTRIRIADLLRETRALFYENGDPTFLGYVFYGDPELAFVAGR